MLWFPVGYTAGYLVLLVLVAAPLRRSGAYTLPDFAEARTESRTVRRIASILVVTIGWLYLLPQLVGAGLTRALATGAPEWVGGLLIAVVVVFSVATGGMRSITFVQAFQYWLKLTALAVPVLFLVLAWRADGGPTPGAGPATFPDRTAVRVTRDTGFVVRDAVQVRVDGELAAPSTGATTSYAGQRVTLQPGTWRVAAPATLTFPAGAEVPHATSLEPSDGDDWARPLSGAGGRDHPLYATYSLILALFFGTMGLPHVLVRFYTNPDGRAARRTTLVVLALLGGFYLLPTIYGALGPGLHTGPAADRPHRHRRAAAAGAAGRRHRSASCSTALVTAGRVRGVPVDVLGTHRVGGRRAVAGHAARLGARLPARRRRVGGGAVRPVAGRRRRSRSPTSWGSPSPWRRRRSARCSCSASGGAG